VSRRPAATTQADIARAIRAAQQYGAGIVEIKPDGTIYVRVSPQVTAEIPKNETRPGEPLPVEPKRKVVL
jgi:hypothetical protein